MSSEANASEAATEAVPLDRWLKESKTTNEAFGVRVAALMKREQPFTPMTVRRWRHHDRIPSERGVFKAISEATDGAVVMTEWLG